MIKQLAAARYAKAYFAHCQQSNILNETSIESEKVLEIIFKEKNLNEIIKNKIVPNTTKKNILLSIYGGVSENLKNLIKTLVRKNRLYLFEDILNQFVELYKINSGIQTCYLISAEKISSKIEENLKHIVRAITKNKIKIVNIVNKDLIGGFIIKVGDLQFDNSVNSTLSRLKASLKKENTFN